MDKFDLKNCHTDEKIKESEKAIFFTNHQDYHNQNISSQNLAVYEHQHLLVV